MNPQRCHELRTRLMILLAITVLTSVSTRGSAIEECDDIALGPGTTTLQFDYEVTGNGPCFRADTANSTLDMDGHSITCNNTSSDCSSAIDVDVDGFTIKDGLIESGTNDFTFAINAISPGIVHDTRVLRMTIADAGTGIVGGEDIERSVFKGIQGACITYGLVRALDGGLIDQNYCESGATGFAISGPATGSVTVRKNYIRALTTGFIVNQNLDIEKNIIDSADPFSVVSSSGVTFSKNLCSDTDCDEPDDTPFTLNLNW